ncbi:glycoside hydrolase family 73 protein [Ligilactobacillus equi]|uniref:Mannosyl-glycoprotein endo-beta-N-acetylglucosamidase n=2 Tax=Ligilactobacillus equi TaxID=137357 RepID=A0A0R1TJ78_9LACO|nr:glucosaminidase domain-containing protein [Ligilactobacillus equi]KRL78664.1 Mannosyl-glycoprotein endo-beta-N-acetylglucosamidase [Ligilactobacillus equi DSM 15833 = JCM 10991]
MKLKKKQRLLKKFKHKKLVASSAIALSMGIGLFSGQVLADETVTVTSEQEDNSLTGNITQANTQTTTATTTTQIETPKTAEAPVQTATVNTPKTVNTVTDTTDMATAKTATAPVPSTVIDETQDTTPSVPSITKVHNEDEVAKTNAQNQNVSQETKPVITVPATTTNTTTTTQTKVAATSNTATNFFNYLGETARQVANDYNIYASMLLAQAGLESAYGQSTLSTQAHNYFGIKYRGTGNYVTMNTLEFYGGQYHTVSARFQRYDSLYDSLAGYARLITQNYPNSTRAAGSVEAAVNNLYHGRYGAYATDPSYASKIMGLINTYNLKQYDYVNQNVGHIDSISLVGNTLKVSGWHAADNSKAQNHGYIIVYDVTSNHEITRQAYSPTSRGDVYKVYPRVYNSGNSGFNVTINLGNYDLTNKEIKVISRFSNQSNGEGAVTDLWSDGYIFKQSLGNIDSAYIDGTELKVSGWHAATDAVKHPYNYIILYDATDGTELSRKKVTATRRPDVERAYPNLYNAVNSGFSVSFDLSKLNFVAGHNLQVVMRYAANSDGEGDRIDVWSGKYNFNGNEAVIDTAKFKGTKLHVTGWHAADASRNQPNAFLILFDKTANHEVARVKIGTSNAVASAKAVNRPDVAKAKNYYNDGLSGFDAYFDFSKLNFVAGHQYQIVSRFSDATNGEGNRTDVWSGIYNFNGNEAIIDTAKIEGTKLHLAGWHAADASRNQANPYIILYDKTAGREIARIKVGDRNNVATSKLVMRSDVQRLKNYYNADKSGFDVEFDLTKLNFVAGHEYQIVSRYSDATNGEGHRTDVWSDVYKFTANAGHLDTVKANHQKNSLTVTGWHAADASINQKNAFIILYDATTGHEISRQTYTPSKRTDVARVYPNIYNAANSGFDLTFKNLNLKSLAGHNLQVVARYSNQKNGEGSRTDYWSRIFKL